MRRSSSSLSSGGSKAGRRARSASSLLLSQQRQRGPGAAQRDAHVAVAQRDGDAQLLRHARGFEQLAARHHAELAAEAPLVRRQQEVEQQRRELAVLDHLAQVEAFPAILLRQRVEAALVELDAHGSRGARAR